MRNFTSAETRPDARQPAIVSTPVIRAWRGATAADRADEYISYLETTGFAEYQKTPGNRGVLALRREVDGRSELLILTLWESEEAIRGFAGDDVHRAMFYPEDDEFLLARDETAEHYEIAYAAGRPEALTSGLRGGA